jgi:hypothetical protein
MWPFTHAQAQYAAIAASDCNHDFEDETKSRLRHLESSFWPRLVSVSLIGLLCLVIGFIGGKMIQDIGLVAKLNPQQVSKCRNPTTRREWRSLSEAENDGYIGAVRCLLTKPSKIRTEGVLYDDFPYIHNQIGDYCKYSLFGRKKTESRNRLRGLRILS